MESTYLVKSSNNQFMGRLLTAFDLKRAGVIILVLNDNISA
jgi:hypothetical protein